MDVFNNFVSSLDIQVQCHILNKIRDIISIWNHRRPEVKECLIELTFDYLRIISTDFYMDSRIILSNNEEKQKSLECLIRRDVDIVTHWTSAFITFRLPYSSLLSFIPRQSNKNNAKDDKEIIQSIVWLYSLSTSELAGLYPNWADDNELVTVIIDLINLASYSIHDAIKYVKELDETNQSLTIISGLYSNKGDDGSSCHEYKFSLESLRKQLFLGKKIAFFSRHSQLKILSIPNVINGFELIISKRYYVEPNIIIYYDLIAQQYYVLNNNEIPMIADLEKIIKDLSDSDETYTALEFTIFDKYEDAILLKDRLINKHKNTLGSRKSSFQLNMNKLENSLKNVSLDSPENKHRKGKEKKK